MFKTLNRNRNSLKLSYRFVILLISFSTAVHAQQLMKGIVADSATFAPLPHVSIQVKNTGRGTTSDVKGNFGIVATPEDTLVFSLVGYERLELPLYGYDASVILMAQRATMLKAITIDDYRIENSYEGLFDDANVARLKQRIPFYYSKSRKDKIYAGRWREESLHVQTYVDVVINNPETKEGLKKKFGLSEGDYYRILTMFNEKHYNVMYHLTAAELTSFLNRFFETNAGQ